MKDEYDDLYLLQMRKQGLGMYLVLTQWSTTQLGKKRGNLIL